MISPSTHVFWNIAAPRALVAADSIGLSRHRTRIPSVWKRLRENRDTRFPSGRSCMSATDEDFVKPSGLDRVFGDSRQELIQKYGESGQFRFIQGEAISVDFEERVVYAQVLDLRSVASLDDVVVETTNPEIIGVPFHALVIATGSSGESPLLSLQGPHEQTHSALTAFHSQLRNAARVVIAGGGPSGCEIAGQIAQYYPCKPSTSSSKQQDQRGKRGEECGTDGTEGQLSSHNRFNPIPGIWNTVTRSLACKRQKTLPSTRSQECRQTQSHNNRGQPSPPTSQATKTHTLSFPKPAHTSSPSIAGCMGSFLRCSRWFAHRDTNKEHRLKEIILISGHSTLLPNLPPKLGTRAERQLSQMGVTIVHGNRVRRTETNRDRLTGKVQTRIEMERGPDYVADAYVAATGVRPNTSFLHPEALDANGFVIVDPVRLNVLGVGPRVYALGDCASYSRMTTLDVYEAAPVVQHNLANELIEYEIRCQFPYVGAEEHLQESNVDVEAGYVAYGRTTLLMPLTRWGGVGLIFGLGVPSWVVWAMKGRDYRVGMMKRVINKGKNPYAPHSYLIPVSDASAMGATEAQCRRYGPRAR